MTWPIGVLCCAAWIGCGILAAGFLFAYAQGQFALVAAQHRRIDLFLSLALSMLGPITLIVALGMTQGGRYGWKLRP